MLKYNMYTVANLYMMGVELASAIAAARFDVFPHFFCNMYLSYICPGQSKKVQSFISCLQNKPLLLGEVVILACIDGIEDLMHSLRISCSDRLRISCIAFVLPASLNAI